MEVGSIIWRGIYGSILVEYVIALMGGSVNGHRRRQGSVVNTARNPIVRRVMG